MRDGSEIYQRNIMYFITDQWKNRTPELDSFQKHWSAFYFMTQDVKFWAEYEGE